ncbi:MAG: hypothetical protein M3479_09660 [Actinomycetota bacterium]|nr:hypothetical protein [Actinomycetota bacterium]
MRNLIRSRKSRFAAVLATGAVSLGIVAGPASAQQDGLVNVNISGNTVQVPVAVAANLCNVAVNVLAQDLAQDGTADCNATADPDATATRTRGGGGPQQQGLVNLNVSGNTVQVPVAVAANVCNVAVNVLAQDLAQDGTADCNATADPDATATRGPRA